MEFVYYIFLPALAGGIIQGVTGFGAGVVMMMFLPLQYSVVQSAGISSAICMILCAAMVYRYRKTINFKNGWVSCLGIDLNRNLKRKLNKIIED